MNLLKIEIGNLKSKIKQNYKNKNYLSVKNCKTGNIIFKAFM